MPFVYYNAEKKRRLVLGLRILSLYEKSGVKMIIHKQNLIKFFYVLCHTRALAIIILHNSLSFVALSNYFPINIPLRLCSVTHSQKLVM